MDKLHTRPLKRGICGKPPRSDYFHADDSAENQWIAVHRLIFSVTDGTEVRNHFMILFAGRILGNHRFQLISMQFLRKLSNRANIPTSDICASEIQR